MNHPKKITTGKWKQLHFRNGKFIPTGSLIKELIVPPHPTHILDLLGIYKVPLNVRNQIENILIDSLNEKNDWHKIMKILKESLAEDSNFHRLYRLVSRNYYRLDCKIDDESLGTLVACSNSIVDFLEKIIHSPFVDDLKIKSFCDSHAHDYEDYRFNQLLMIYYTAVLPYPFNDRDNNDKLEISTAEDLEVSIQRIVDRFPSFLDLYVSNNKLLQVIGLVDSQTQKNFDLSRSETIAGIVSDTRKKARDQRNQDLLQHLYQCPFCYRFSLQESPHPGKDFPQHCIHDGCKDAYKRWKQHLKRLAIPSKS